LFHRDGLGVWGERGPLIPSRLLNLPQTQIEDEDENEDEVDRNGTTVCSSNPQLQMPRFGDCNLMLNLCKYREQIAG